MLYTIKSIKYDTSSKKLVLQAHLPISFNCINKSKNLHLTYSEAEKAENLLNKLKELKEKTKIHDFEVQ